MRTFVLALVLTVALSVHFGVDLSVATDQATFKCLQQEHETSFVIVRAFRSLGAVDVNAGNTIVAASNAGITNIAAYVFPCIQTSAYAVNNNITCPSAEDQIDLTIKELASKSVYFSGNVLSGEPKVVLTRLYIGKIRHQML